MSWKRLGPQVVGQNIDSEVIVADLKTGFFHNIGGSGTLMWNALDRGYSREQILQLLQTAYDASPDALDQSLTEFVDVLVDSDLIKPSEEMTVKEIAPEMQPRHNRPFAPFTFARFDSSDSTLTKKSKLMRWQPGAFVVAESVNDALIVSEARLGLSCTISGTDH